MTANPLDVERSLALWVLDLVTPDEIVASAVGALQAGCVEPSIAIIAGLDAPTRADIEDELPGVLRSLGKPRPSRDQALKILADDLAQQIVTATIDPIDGARTVWSFWGFGRDPDENPGLYTQLRPFVDLAIQCEDTAPPLDTYGPMVIEEAKAFIERGGLRIPEPWGLDQSTP